MIKTAKKSRFISLLAAGMAGLMLSGCASIITGTRQDIAVQTTPPGASCDLSQGDRKVATVPQTPGTVRVGKSYRDIKVDCNMVGYQPVRVAAPSRFQPWAIGNLFLGGVLGLAIDMSTGATSRYAEKVFVNLQPAQPQAGQAYQQLPSPYGFAPSSRPGTNQPNFGYRPQPAPNYTPYGQQSAPAGNQDVLVIDAGN